ISGLAPMRCAMSKAIMQLGRLPWYCLGTRSEVENALAMRCISSKPCKSKKLMATAAWACCGRCCICWRVAGWLISGSWLFSLVRTGFPARAITLAAEGALRVWGKQAGAEHVRGELDQSGVILGADHQLAGSSDFAGTGFRLALGLEADDFGRGGAGLAGGVFIE